MPDITISSELNNELHGVLTDVLALPCPFSKEWTRGRYVLSKAATKVEAAFKVYAQNEAALIERCAVKDDDGKVVYKKMDGGRIGFDLESDKQEEYAAAIKVLREEPVTLAGVRQITHAELGQCPITGAQEKVLIAAGLLEDAEPA